LLEVNTEPMGKKSPKLVTLVQTPLTHPTKNYKSSIHCISSRYARYFLVQHTKIGQYLPNEDKAGIPNGHKIKPHGHKLENNFILKGLQKFAQKSGFVMKIYYI
jgi:hypothetical protein